MMYLGSGKMSYVLISLGLLAILAFIGYAPFGYVRLRLAVIGFNVVDWQH